MSKEINKPPTLIPAVRHAVTPVASPSTLSTNGYMLQRGWQARCSAEIDHSHHWIINAPMASGKTFQICVMTGKWLDENPALRAVVAVPQTIIAEGFRDNRIEYSDGSRLHWVIQPEHDLCAESPKSSTKHLSGFLADLPATSVMDRVVLCTHATLVRAFAANPDAFNDVLVVIDEAHHISDQNKIGALVKHALANPDRIRLGLTTATFFRGDGLPIVPDLSQFTRFEYPYNEFLESCDHLRSFSYDFCTSASFIEPLNKLFQERVGKTIVYIPYVRTRSSIGSKSVDVAAVIKAIAGTDTPEVRDEDAAVMHVKRGDRWIRVVNLVDEDGRPDKNAAIAAAHHMPNGDYLDVIIALGMFKEGANWRHADREIIIGERSSLTEVVQTVGRMFRDVKDKSHVETIQILPFSFGQDESEKRSDVNDFLKAILLSMLLENVYSPVQLPDKRKKRDGSQHTPHVDYFKQAAPNDALRHVAFVEIANRAVAAIAANDSFHDIDVFRAPYGVIVSEVLSDAGISQFHEEIAEQTLRMFFRSTERLKRFNVGHVEMNLIKSNPFGCLVQYASEVCGVDTFKALRAVIASPTWKTFDEAKTYVEQHGFTQDGFNAWEERPDDIPSNPNVVYKDSGWVSWGDFLGTGEISKHKKTFRTFDKAKAYMKPLEFKQEDFQAWEDRPGDIPAAPNRIYKDSGWVSWGDFLGTGAIASRRKKFRPFDEAKAYMKPLEFSQEDFRAWEDRPDDIPASPHDVYKGKGWISWGDFLGRDKRAYKTYEEAEAFMKPLGFCTTDFQRWRERPKDIPSRPYDIYKGKGWVSWSTFLGTNGKRGRPPKRAA
jgi:hypothetical protein